MLLVFNSQILPGFNYSTNPVTKISSFLTPGKILVAPGIDHKPNEKFFLSPVTARWVFKADNYFYNIVKFGVYSAKGVNGEIGSFVTARYINNISSWATYTGRVDLFSNYRRNPQNIDVLMNYLLT